MIDEQRQLALREQRLKNLTRMGKGRPPGSKNVLSAEVKQAFMDAFEGLGGADSLMKWAKKNPGAFYTLVAKLLPSKMEASVTGQQVVVQIIGLDKPVE